ncbi:uncharacterized protein CTRU02_200981 [Colletotrichum truncatum]|uniref:Uncharacterized protein n=1 Tax=Colletotrichum truncatum TaxID=5467 RepID=A0ACC3ZGG6_COLTU|nr:uncharacterized protein CTRU02_00749 [Colletotrichum truncatum]KAF6802000.1 hypothetical protein CTRU02_00749 [Colletotrichum truncatum]
MHTAKTLFGLGLFLSGVLAQSSTVDAVPPWQTGILSEDGTCGSGTPGWVCTPAWGACCSKDGLCGYSSAFCGDGCQEGFGECDSTSPPPPGPGDPSPDGTCGGTNGFNCTGTAYGNCCSSGGFCGSSPAHCDTGW